MTYWKSLGGTSAVKAAMSDLHLNANNPATPEDATKVNYIKQCYGIVARDRPTTAASNFVSDVPAPPTEPLVTPVLVLWFDALDPNGTGTPVAKAL
jgi:hypothetical protein